MQHTRMASQPLQQCRHPAPLHLRRLLPHHPPHPRYRLNVSMVTGVVMVMHVVASLVDEVEGLAVVVVVVVVVLVLPTMQPFLSSERGSG